MSKTKNYSEETKRLMVEKMMATKKARGYHTVKFTWEQVERMRYLSFNKLMPNTEIMKMFDVCKFTFYKILNGEIYSESNPTHLKALPNFGEENTGNPE